MASGTDPFARVDRLVERADALAGAWAARARASTTLGQERAILRLFGVTGVDRDGRPLAGSAVDRWLATSADGLGGGIALPFAMALLEYDLEPQQLAMDVASGAVDLALEAQLLSEPDRRAVAEAEARRLASLALERIDADRVARAELEDLLGAAERPWIGTTLAEPDLDGALDEVVALASAGFDLLRVEVPMGRELADRLAEAGQDVPEWQPSPGRGDRGSRGAVEVGANLEDGDPAPTGSQRALGRLRRVADGVAAERRGYVRLATAIPPLGVPEGAVVAAFERVDLVEADPMAEIVVGGVDPDRSLADHAFARRLHRRAGTLVSIGPGPLVVAPDLARGVPADAPTRSGRALALQLVGVALSLADGIAADRIVVGAYPPWLGDEPAGSARILAEVALRRRLFPGHVMRFDEPGSAATAGAEGSGGGSGAATEWPFVMAGVLSLAGEDSIIMRRPRDDARRAVADGRAAARVSAQLAEASGERSLDGVAASHVAETVAAALATLELLTDLGWRAVVGDGPGGSALGADAVAERTEPFDPFGGG